MYCLGNDCRELELPDEVLYHGWGMFGGNLAVGRGTVADYDTIFGRGAYSRHDLLEI